MTTKFQNIKISKKTVIFVILTVFFVVLDRFFKILCLEGFFNQPIPVIGDIFSLHYIKNQYIAFSLPFSGPILTSLIGLIIIILTLNLLKSLLSTNSENKTPGTNYALTILIVGAILNFVDRIQFGYVIDYFDTKYFTIFNLADCFIFIGVVWLLYSSKKKRSAAS